MKIIPVIQSSWRALWVLKKHHPEPLWAQLAVGLGLAIPVGFCMMFINGLLRGRAFDLFGCVCVAFGILAVRRAVEMLLPNASIDTIARGAGLRAALVINIIAIAGTALGTALSMSVYSWFSGRNYWSSFLAHGAAQTVFLAFVTVIAMANWFWWRLRVRQDTLVHQTMEAQLRLLQAQIEPHFLFNTLANVQSLMHRDTARANRMLESFTDYLRASLGQLRTIDSTLATELAMIGSYLELLQIRMEERLQFDIDASDEALAATLPTLLLQPLVENAIEHGLESKLEGGRISIRARVVDGRLEVRVDDDGMGLASVRRPGRQGSGMALSNIRARLTTRYGPNATLTLTPLAIGMQAALVLPYTPQLQRAA
jgi:signal transduction histidine kinase